MALVGIDGRWLEVNRSLCTITGFDRDVLLAKGFDDITLPEDRETDELHARRLLEGEIPGYRIEKRFVHAAGHPVWVSFSASLVRIGDDEFAAILVETGSATARAVAGRLVEAVRAIGVESGNVRTTASVGIAIVDGRAGQTSEEVLVAADRAMYSAKREGGDRFAM